MGIALRNGWKWLLGSILTLLGFSNVFIGCKKEYGCPYADYKLVGDVKDSKGNPVEGIRVVFVPAENYGSDTTFTDAKGHFEQDHLRILDMSTGSKVLFQDVDGSNHGSFKEKEVGYAELTVEQTKKGDKNWYIGGFTIHADAVMEEEE